jgi:hypothetical protein
MWAGTTPALMEKARTPQYQLIACRLWLGIRQGPCNARVRPGASYDGPDLRSGTAGKARCWLLGHIPAGGIDTLHPGTQRHGRNFRKPIASFKLQI